MAFFLNQVEEGHLEEQLQDVAIVVDGFTRFSAEEEALISLLHRKGVELSSGSMPVKKLIEQALEREIFTRPVLIFSSSWQRHLRYSLSIVGKRSKTLLVALPAC